MKCHHVALAFVLLFAPPAAHTAAPAAPQAASVAFDQEAPVSVPPPSEKALRYYRSGNVLWVVNLLWSLAIPLLFLFSGFSTRIRDWARRLGRKWFFIIAVYFVLFSVICFAIDLPLSYYEEYFRQHAYGLSTQTFQKWAGDSLKGLIVGLVMGCVFLWIPYLLLEKSPRRWWLYSSILAVPFLFFIMLISPIWIDPLYNEYGPMKNKELEGKILALAERAGIEGSRVFEVNKSVDTRAVNAYVTGFLGTKRIVLWDTLLAKMDDREVLVVMAHEMGHYVLHHVVWGIVFASLLILSALYSAYSLAERLIKKFKVRWGFEQLSDIASLPLILVLTGVLAFLLSPVALAYSRYQEHEADRFALEMTRSNHAAATAFVKLQRENLGVPRPGPLYKMWRETHPSIGERIDFCNDYKPWKTGQSLKYADLFKEQR